MTTEELLKLTVETLDKKKGMDIKALKVTDLTVIAEIRKNYMPELKDLEG